MRRARLFQCTNASGSRSVSASNALRVVDVAERRIRQSTYLKRTRFVRSCHQDRARLLARELRVARSQIGFGEQRRGLRIERVGFQDALRHADHDRKLASLARHLGTEKQRVTPIGRLGEGRRQRAHRKIELANILI